MLDVDGFPRGSRATRTRGNPPRERRGPGRARGEPGFRAFRVLVKTRNGKVRDPFGPACRGRIGRRVYFTAPGIFLSIDSDSYGVERRRADSFPPYTRSPSGDIGTSRAIVYADRRGLVQPLELVEGVVSPDPCIVGFGRPG